ncbi:hypothetical protein K435DRAFT_729210 [Dendrothele bispora CBS 962.96]|uniref:HMG box domain-containing protein n=1 Tax=Dendrothele bispora (strain CBS 962.96) TaxID=1314807 RepID=A0A4S8LKH4_DENBC|nr:hypothetical protein K435DRAFT_729210 [Dendrothele bispora CBS 962.96]
MLYRSYFWSTQKDTISERDHRQISRLTGVLWNKLPEDQKEVFRKEAEAVKKEHMAKFPDYKYAPSREAGSVGKNTTGRRGLIGRSARTQVKSGSSRGKQQKAGSRKRVSVSKTKLKAEREEEALESRRCQHLAEELLNDTTYASERTPRPSSSPAPSPFKIENEADMDGYADAGNDVKREQGAERVDEPEVELEASPLSTPRFSYPFGVHYKSQLDSDDEEDVFVPTEDIPPLDLSTPDPFKSPRVEPKANKVKCAAKPVTPLTVPSTIFDPSTTNTPALESVPVPPSYVHIDPQFGVKPDTHRLSPSPDSSSPCSPTFSEMDDHEGELPLLFSKGSDEADLTSFFTSCSKPGLAPSSSLASSSTASSRLNGLSPFTDHANPDTWLPSADNSHYLLRDPTADTSDSRSSNKYSSAELSPSLHLNELFQPIDMDFDLEPSILLNDVFDEFVMMPMEEF